MRSRFTRLAFPVVLIAAAWQGLMAQTPPASPAPPPLSVDSLIAAGRRDASAARTAVFVEFGASWCAPCQRLQAFLEAPEIAPIIRRHFTIVNVTVWETGGKAGLNNPGGDELLKKWGGRAIPFYAVLGGDGAPALDSRDVGFPEDTEDIGAFVALLAKGAPRMTPAERTTISDHLIAGAPARGWMVTSKKRIWREGEFSYRPSLSADGRMVASTDYGAIFVQDLARNTTRQIVLPPSAKDGDDADVYDQPAFSPDGRSIAVSYMDWKTNRRDLRIVPTDATTVPEKALFADPGVEWIRPHQWTKDGKFIFVELKRGASCEIARLSTADGSLKTLKKLTADELADDANYTSTSDTNLLLSPDEQYMVFDVFVTSDRGSRDVHLMRLSDGVELPGIVHAGEDAVFGWTADGHNLFFVSDRRDLFDLWVAPFKDGVFGDPVVARQNIGDITPLGVMPNGSLVYAEGPTAMRDVWAFQLDFTSGEVLKAPYEFVHELIGSNRSPGWSSDGTEFLYMSGSALTARSTATGARRQISDMFTSDGRYWSPDGRAFAAKDGAVIRRVDARTGVSTELVTKAGALRAWSADNKILFERRVTEAGTESQVGLFEHDVATGAERELFRGRQGGAARLAVAADGRFLYYRSPVPVATPPHDLIARDLKTGAERALVSKRTLGGIQVSPDGRFILTSVTDPVTKASQWLLIPTTAGSEPRPLQVDNGPMPGLVMFGPDSQSILAARNMKGTMEYRWIPFDGRPAKRFTFPGEMRAMQSPQVGPDGKTVAFVKTTILPAGGVWLMDFER